MRLTCAQAEACLVGVTDGQLNPSLEVRVHAHLEECAACRKKADLWWTLVPTMRALSPPPPAEFAVRRMEVALLRSLGADGTVESPPRRRWRAALAAALFVTAAAAALWFRVANRPAETGTVVLTRLVGSVTSAGEALAIEASLPFGRGLAVAAGGEAELRMDRGSILRLVGPARLTLQGSSRQALLRLDEGTLEAQVAHRLADETFAVSARDLTVRVRGTRFVVETGNAGSTVRVKDGLVAVELTDGSTRMLGTAEQLTTIAPSANIAPALVPAAPAAIAPPEGPGGDSLSCAAAVRRCEGTARAVRARMRAGGDGGALRLLASASRLAREVAPTCAHEISSCGDELGYLRAEALSASGRIDEAVNAYAALNRPTAPVAMRQNALFAAAELERRRGRTASARRYYDSARSADPRGALREEALIGSMETAAEAGDSPHARALAKKYLADFPAGRASVSARRLLREGSGPTTNRSADP